MLSPHPSVRLDSALYRLNLFGIFHRIFSFVLARWVLGLLASYGIQLTIDSCRTRGKRYRQSTTPPWQALPLPISRIRGLLHPDLLQLYPQQSHFRRRKVHRHRTGLRNDAYLFQYPLLPVRRPIDLYGHA